MGRALVVGSGHANGKAWSAAILLALACPAVSRAHLVSTGIGPFYDGWVHVLITPEELLGIVGLALLAGLGGALHGRRALCLLTGAWVVCGGIALQFPVALPPTLFFAVFLVGLGGLVAADLPLPAWATSGIALLLGAVYGAVSGSTMAATERGWTGLAGSVAVVFVVVALCSATVVGLRPPWTRIAVRVAGSWIVAIGLLLIGWSFRIGSG